MRKRDRYLVCLAVLPFRVYTGVVYSILSLFMTSLGLSKSQIGSLFTVEAVAGAVTSPF